jgi:hypothetical protein
LPDAAFEDYGCGEGGLALCPSLLKKRKPAEAAMSLKRYFSLLLLIVVALGCGGMRAQKPIARETAATEPPSEHPKEVYPQIVRLSLVQGDVRVAVGKVKGQPEVAPWVNAVVNMPLESGFSVVTGKGRAEIEFEDASTIYLGENSVLAFDDLSTTDNVPNTELTLLTGVVTLHLRPTIAGDTYRLNTPSDFLRIRSNADVRINSYTDAMTVTPVLLSTPHPGDPKARLDLIGKTFKLEDGAFSPAAPPAGSDYAPWDAWVAKRVGARAETMNAVMKEAGLSAPLPGLEDMNAKGTFFACKPYGTCWLPNKGWGGKQAAARPGGVVAVSAKVGARGDLAGSQEVPTSEAQTLEEPQTQRDSAQQESTQQEAQTQQVPTPEQTRNAKLAMQAQFDEEQAEWPSQGGGVAPALWVEEDYAFPCTPYAVENLMGQDPLTGEVAVLASNVVWNGGFDNDGFGWAVCHAGSWIYWNHRYTWVAGQHRHHHCPVQWVKAGGRVGYVPIHPHDGHGKEPENLKHGIFVPTDRKGGGMQRVAYEPGAHLKVLGQTPREFRQPQMPTLRAAAAPSLEARSLRGGVAGNKVIAPTSLIAFDSHARGFTVTSQVNEGGRNHTVVDHFSGGISGGSGGGRDFSGGGGGRAFAGGGQGGHAFAGGGQGGHAFAGGGGSRSSGGGGSSSGGASHSSGGGGGSVSSASASGGGASVGGGGAVSTGGGGGSHGH